MKSEKEIREHTTGGIPDEILMKTYDFKGYQAKYRSKNKAYCFNLNSDRDKDIIAWLDKQENKSQAISKALRKALKGVRS